MRIVAKYGQWCTPAEVYNPVWSNASLLPSNRKYSSLLGDSITFFIANDVLPDKWVMAFISSVGGKTYSQLRDLLSPVKPRERQLKEVFTALKSHYEPQPLIIAEQFYFHERNQAANESNAEYLVALRQFATHCAFAKFLNNASRDHLVYGLHNMTIQKWFLCEKGLTLDTALYLARSMEATDAYVMKLQGDDPSAPVNCNNASKPCQTRKIYYRCGGNNHTPTACWYKDFTCNKCKKKGHLVKVCRIPGRQELPSTPNRQQGQTPQDAHNLAHKKSQHNIQEPSVDELASPMFKVDKKKSFRPITVTRILGQQYQ